MQNLHRFFLAIGLFTLVSSSFALPPCQGSIVAAWNNCSASQTFDNGNKYVGDYKDGLLSGQGTFFFIGDSQWKGDKYVGEFKYGKYNGQGTYTFANGIKYVGEWSDDKYNGRGVLYLSDGSVSQSGIWNDNNLVTSQYIDPNSFTRIASVSTRASDADDERIERQRSQSRLPNCPASGYFDNCLGTFKFDSGNKYVGEWKEDKLHGQGTYTWTDGDKLVGEYKNDKLNGQGTYTFANGRKYVGEFADGKYNGRGIFYLANGNVSESGIWRDNKLVTSQYIDPNSFTRIAKGNSGPSVAETQRLENERKAAQLEEERRKFEEEKRQIALERQRVESQKVRASTTCQGSDSSRWNNCVGRWTSKEGNSYEGDFKNGLRDGQGTYSWIDGDKYFGSWKDGEITGQGTFLFAGGNSYIGEFVAGLKDGQGTFIWKSGGNYLGEYKNDKRHGRGIVYLADGSISQTGIWSDGTLVTSQYVDPNSFTRIAKGNSAPSTAEAQRLENERKAAQLEEERRRLDEEKRQAALERQRLENQKAQVQVQAQVAPDNRRRLALVIGNDNYSSMPRLNNAVNDAKSMSEALRQANFEVMSYSNLDKRRMEEVLRNFTGKLGRDDVGLFYFSGHGIQADNRNFLIPVSENVKKTSEVPYEGIDVNRVMDNLKDAKNALNIVVLDACRSSLPDARGGLSRGLTVTDAPQGSIIAYATSPGKTASDGDGGNSPYTKNLIKAMQRKGVKIEDVFKEVRQSVIRDTNGEQTPSETSYLVGDFYFKP